ncbi:MAG: hypothetical protein I8H75_02055 [Myxococcaceae bacterium]|nr:hypothetical protein [Myxococcaceae bacterium]MBH2006119.1 hypothetical protein [Myxococcaceae bacterium]
MNNKLVLCFLLLNHFGFAGYFHETNVSDTVANEALIRLISNKTLPEKEQKGLMSVGLHALLQYLSPQIQAMPDYVGRFRANCSLFMNFRIEKVSCDVTWTWAEMKAIGYNLSANFHLPSEYLEQIRQSDIMLVNIDADWSGKTTAYSEQYALGQFTRTLPCALTASVTGPSETTTEWLSSSKSQNSSQTPSESLSKSWDFSATTFISRSKTASRILTNSNASLSLGCSNSVTDTASETFVSSFSTTPSFTQIQATGSPSRSTLFARLSLTLLNSESLSQSDLQTGSHSFTNCTNTTCR